MARKQNYENRDKVRFSVTLPSSVAEDIKRTAEDRGISAAYFYSQLLCEGYSHYRTQKAVEALHESLDTQYLALELIGAKLDEIVKLLGLRTPAPKADSAEQRETMSVKAETLARNVSNSARKAVQDFRTGDSTVDPLGTEKLLEFFKTYIEEAGASGRKDSERSPEGE